jgi:3-hydroxy-9,10-secoandrosta-1,3,5(10)-triene-9,17-dione monooxygenase
MAVGFGAGAIATDKARDVPKSSIEALRAAGLFRIFQPKRWDGLEADPLLFFDIQNAIAESCASTAWVYGVLSVQPLVLARFDERAQRDVWGDNPDALVCSSFAPMGKAQKAEGGYRLSGRWSFSSGSSHAQWCLIGAKDEGAPPPGVRLFLVPRGDFVIDDVWDTFGLRGTGSHDLLVEDAFVPAYRSQVVPAGTAFNPNADMPDGEIYRIPWSYLASASIANFTIGVARGALRAFLKMAKTKISSLSGAAAKDDPMLIAAAARLDAEIDQAETTMRRNFEILLDHVRQSKPLTAEDGLRLRLQITSIARRLAAGLDSLMLHVGASGINNASPITRAWLDLMAARVHPGNDPTMPTAMYGAALIAKA